MSEVAFTVDGIPEAQGSMRAITIAGKARIVPGGDNKALKRHKAWRRAVTVAARAAMDGARPIDSPVRVDLIFRMPRPPSVKRPRPSVPPDIDKLCRSILDSLTDARVFSDDGRVCDLLARKRYEDPEHPPGVDVRVRAI